MARPRPGWCSSAVISPPSWGRWFRVIGATKISDLGPHYLMWKDIEDLRRNQR